MLKWKALAIGGLAFGMISTGWAIAEQRRDDARVFELRVYKTMPGKRDALAARFRDHTSAMFARAGMENVGYWNAVTGDDTDDTFVYMLAYPSQEARDEMWRELGTYDDFKELIIAAEGDENSKLVDTIDARLIAPTSYSALK